MKKRSLQIRATDRERDMVRAIVRDSGTPLSAMVLRMIEALHRGDDILRREDILAPVPTREDK